MRAGTENLPAIVGFAKAVKVAITNLNDYQKHTANLVKFFESKLHEFLPNVQIFGDSVNRIPNTSNFTIPESDNETSLINLDLSGYALSAGSACSSGRVVSSHVLAAMGVNGKIAKQALRLSVGLETTKEDITGLLVEVEKIYQRNGLKSAA